MDSSQAIRVRLGDLSGSVIEAIERETKHYTVPLVINETPLGSGTLVVIDGYFGILTAEHVVRHPHKSELHLTNVSHKGPRLVIPPMDFPARIEFESFSLRVVTTNRKRDDYGPDLAFIIMPPSGALSELRARRSFYPLAKAPNQKTEEALQDTGFVAFCGFLGSKWTEEPPELGFSKVNQLGGYAFLTGPEKYQERNGWDYYELGIRREQMGDFGDSFGGVSGGGVWRVPVSLKKGDAIGKEYFERMTFAGVAFYEENHLPNGRFFVRTHGPRSIYQTFLPEIRKQLSGMA
jgi:hypothetical protein